MRAVLPSSGLIVARNGEIRLKQSTQELIQIGTGLTSQTFDKRFWLPELDGIIEKVFVFIPSLKNIVFSSMRFLLCNCGCVYVGVGRP